VKKNPSPFPLVVLTWNDACGTATAIYNEEKDHQPTVMRTAGWLLKADKVGVSIACERYDEGDGKEAFRGHTFIPAGMVVSVKKVG
jgi:hypothetical protein